MKFKDEDGREFEDINRVCPHLDSDNYIIKPIKAEPKWEVENIRGFDGDRAVWRGIRISVDNATEDQAQLIKVLIEKIMFGLNGSNVHYFDDTIRKAFDEARRFLQKENTR